MATMRWIYLSPHLDDVVLSAGGFIYEQTQQGIPVEIWTFMCGYPPEGELSLFAQVMHQQWDTTTANETVRLRREEDKNATAILGAKAVHFDFLDCIYRRGPSGDWLYADVFVPPHEADADMSARIAEAISARLIGDDVLVCQLSIGSHVDHVIVRRAAEMLGRPLLYDADIPYLLDHPDELSPNTAGMKESIHGISEPGLRSWQEAFLAYQSQIEILFKTPERARESIHRYWEECKGIRFWEFR